MLKATSCNAVSTIQILAKYKKWNSLRIYIFSFSEALDSWTISMKIVRFPIKNKYSLKNEFFGKSLLSILLSKIFIKTDWALEPLYNFPSFNFLVESIKIKLSTTDDKLSSIIENYYNQIIIINIEEY